jgi:hypothetical protein
MKIEIKEIKESVADVPVYANNTDLMFCIYIDNKPIAVIDSFIANIMHFISNEYKARIDKNEVYTQAIKDILLDIYKTK